MIAHNDSDAVLGGFDDVVSALRNQTSSHESHIIEPAQHGVAIIVGNHTENFRDMVELFRSRDAVRVAGPAEFPLLLMDLLSNDAERQALGQRAAETLRSQMGATQRTLAALEGLLQPPRERPEMSRAGRGIV